MILGFSFLPRPVLLLLCLAYCCLAQEPGKPAAIVLPQKIVAGQKASLTVLDSTGALLPGANVELTGGKRFTTDATGRATFLAPDLPENTRSAVLVATLAGTDVKESVTVLAALPPPLVPLIHDAPPIVAATDRFAVSGCGFPGESNSVRARLRNQPAIVLAASPLSLVILGPPRIEPGPTQLVLEMGGHTLDPVPITLVAIEVAADKATLAPRQKGKLRVRVVGTEQSVEVEVRNLTPEIVSLEGDGLVRARTKGGADNSARLSLAGRKEGEFSISARMLPMPTGTPNVEAARQKLLQARRSAPAGWGPRLDSAIRRMEKHPEQFTRIRDDLEKLLARDPPGDLGKLIEEAWRILIRKQAPREC